MKQKEIEFRAWHIEAHKIIYASPREIFQWLEEGQPIIIMQYTGLTDKNGNKLYEGDVVSYGKEKLLVQFTTDSIENCGCCSRVIAYGYDFSDFVEVECCERIGNIHENPELLK